MSTPKSWSIIYIAGNPEIYISDWEDGEVPSYYGMDGEIRAQMGYGDPPPQKLSKEFLAEALATAEEDNRVMNMVSYYEVIIPEHSKDFLKTEVIVTWDNPVKIGVYDYYGELKTSLSAFSIPGTLPKALVAHVAQMLVTLEYSEYEEMEKEREEKRKKSREMSG